MAKQSIEHKMAVAAKMRCRTPKHGIPFGLNTENCVESTLPILRCCKSIAANKQWNSILIRSIRRESVYSADFIQLHIIEVQVLLMILW